MDARNRVRMQDILVVAEESCQRRHLTTFLRELSPRVETCSSLAAAQAYLCDIVPDSVVAECRFPGGTVAELKALLPNQSDVIVMSAETSAEEAFLLAQLGISYFLSKPVDLERLYDCLAAIQQRRNTHPSVLIRSFGGLRIFLGEAELVFPKKPPHRLLSMIKLMVALGGDQVPVNKMCDALWEADDGDAALNKFYTSVHRLRKMLGSECIVQSNNKISFNQEHVDLDTWRLRRCLEGICRAPEELAFYAQPWLPEDDSTWLESPRQYFMQLAETARANAHPPDSSTTGLSPMPLPYAHPGS